MKKKGENTMEDALTFETEQYPWWLLLMGGILNIIIGILLLVNPAKTTIAFAWVLGLYWFVQGILVLVDMFLDHTAWGWKLFMGVLSILAGIVVMRHPIATAVVIPSVLILLLGIQGLIVGIISLVLAFKGGGWGVGIVGGLSILFGVILIANFANLGTIVALIWVVAILSLVGGIIEIVQAFRQRQAYS
jgi:uncharacterized membrane protein HdeD (DUF308 family)